VPAGITQVEKRAVVLAGLQAGAREIRLIEEPMAAALGAGLPVDEPTGSMVLDVGGGTSEVAVIALSAAICSQSVRIAGDEMDLAIQRYMHERHRLMIGINTSEKVKIRIGSAMRLKTELNMEVAGKSLVDGKPRIILVQDWEVREAIQKAVEAIVQSVLRTMEAAPAALMSDISSVGLHLVGGGGLLKGLSSLITRQSGLRVILDDDPLTTVVRGAARALENRDKYASLFIN
jgi:rod shape-determining protein MreB and related proteins